MPKHHYSRFFWVLIDEKKQLIEYVEFPRGVKPKPAEPHRPRWAQKQTGKRVRLYLPFRIQFKFIKTFNTKAGHARVGKQHWAKASAEIWIVTVVSGGEEADLKNLRKPSYQIAVDRVMVDWLESQDDPHFDLCKNLKSSKVKLEEDVSNDEATYHMGKVSCWRMPDYEEDLMKYANKKTVDLP